MSLLSTIVGMLGGAEGVLPEIEALAIEELESKSRTEIAATIEIPEATVRSLAAKTGVDPAIVLQARDALGEAWADFVLSFIPAPKIVSAAEAAIPAPSTSTPAEG